MPQSHSVVGLSVTKGEPLLWDDMANHERVYPPARSQLAPFGPGMCVPILEPEGASLGVVGLTKRRGRPGFDDQDVAMLGSFASQAVLARRLNDHRAQAEELRVLEERDRIAREMHDHILQELFAAGLTLQSIACAEGAEPPARQRQRLLETVGKLDAVIGQIRTTIFGLQPPVPDQRFAGLVRHRVLDVIQDISGPLGFTPALQFRGPVELVARSVAGDLVAVVREALSNVIRHSRATSVTVEVAADIFDVTVRASDNGCGIGGTTRRSGLRNLRTRAENHGGTFSIASGGGGTTLTWTVPLASTARR